MTQRPNVHIGGNLSGQLIVGNNGVQIQAQGDIVNPVFVERPVQPRPRPVRHRPQRVDDLYGRNRTIAELVAVAGMENAQVLGSDGWGKSSILKHLTYHEIADGFGDGVVFVAAHGLAPDDIADGIHAAFFDSKLEQMGFKPTAAEVRASLNGVRALIVLDDIDLDRRDVDTLLDLAPNSMFITSAQAQTMWSDGLVIDLLGLAPEDGAKLFEHRLRSAIPDENRSNVMRFCDAVHGYPAAIIAAAAAMRRGRLGFSDLGPISQQVDPAGATFKAMDEALTEEERRALAVLEAVEGAPLPAAAVAAASNVQAAERILEGLKQDGIVQAASPRFRLPQKVADYLELPDWRVDTLDGLTSWALGVNDPDLISAAGTGIVHMVEWASRNQRSDKAVKLARAASGGLMLSRRWGQWQRVIELARAAARTGDSPFDEAWAMHQDGTRALCLGDNATAERQLRSAENIRSTIGDRAGLEATQHNLSTMAGAGPIPRRADSPSPPQPPVPPTGGGIPWWLWTIVVAIVVFGGWRVYEYFQDPDEPRPDPRPGVEAGTLFIGPERIDFGEVSIDGFSEDRFELRNEGPGPLQVEAVDLANSDFFDVDHNCGRLDAGDTCTAVVSFNAFEPGEFSDTLIVEQTGSNGTIERVVSAVVTQEPVTGPDLVGEIIDFGTAEFVERDFVFFAVPVEVEFRNQGGMPTEDDFDVSFFWFNPGAEEFQFIPSGRSPDLNDRATVTDTVPESGSITEVFFVAFQVGAFEPGQPVTLQVLVDSCFGEEFIEDPPCRVEEHNENNNLSSPFEIVIDFRNVIE